MSTDVARWAEVSFVWRWTPRCVHVFWKARHGGHMSEKVILRPGLTPIRSAPQGRTSAQLTRRRAVGLRRVVGAVMMVAAVALVSGLVVPANPVAQASGTATTNFINWDPLSGATKTVGAGTGTAGVSNYVYNVTASGTLDVFNPDGSTTSVYVKLSGEAQSGNTQVDGTFNWGGQGVNLPGGGLPFPRATSLRWLARTRLQMGHLVKPLSSLPIRQ
jgi:hypothetical protein